MEKIDFLPSSAPNLFFERETDMAYIACFNCSRSDRGHAIQRPLSSRLNPGGLPDVDLSATLNGGDKT